MQDLDEVGLAARKNRGCRHVLAAIKVVNMIDDHHDLRVRQRPTTGSQPFRGAI